MISKEKTKAIANARFVLLLSFFSFFIVVLFCSFVPAGNDFVQIEKKKKEKEKKRGIIIKKSKKEEKE